MSLIRWLDLPQAEGVLALVEIALGLVALVGAILYDANKGR